MAEREDRSDFRPSGEMLTAHLLVLLKDWSGYGYELAKKLESEGFTGYNSGSLYRTLRQMERSGLITSLWDTSATGPAKRIYSMTGAGSLFLRNWLKMVDMHKSMLEHFLGIKERDSDGSRHDQDVPAHQANDAMKSAAETASGKPTARKTAAQKSAAKPAAKPAGRKNVATKTVATKKGDQGKPAVEAAARKVNGAVESKVKKDSPGKTGGKVVKGSSKMNRAPDRASGASSKSGAKIRTRRNNTSGPSPKPASSK